MTTDSRSSLLSAEDIRAEAEVASADDDLDTDAPQLQREPVHLESRKGRAARRRRQNRQDARPSGRAAGGLQDAGQDGQDDIDEVDQDDADSQECGPNCGPDSDGDADDWLKLNGLGTSLVGLAPREDEAEGGAPLIFVFEAPKADEPPPRRQARPAEPEPDPALVVEAARRLGQRSGQVRRLRAPQVAPVFPPPPPTRRRPPPWYRPPRMPGQR